MAGVRLEDADHTFLAYPNSLPIFSISWSWEQVTLECDLTLSSGIFRRNTVFLSTVFGGAFLFEMFVGLDGARYAANMSSNRGFDQTLTRFWDWNNRGVSRQATKGLCQYRNGIRRLTCIASMERHTA